jgi:hypothetical protein
MSQLNWTMEHLSSLPRQLVAALLVMLACAGARGQSTAVNTPVTMHVTGLSTAMRDDLVQQATVLGLRVEFACVPAGILVVSSTQAASRSALETLVGSVLRDRNASAAVTTTTMTLEQAEQACATARNQ